MILDHYVECFAAFLRDMSQWIAQGQIRFQEDIVEGLEQAPDAFIGLLQGATSGSWWCGWRSGSGPTRCRSSPSRSESNECAMELLL
jgi:hypothetical protein